MNNQLKLYAITIDNGLEYSDFEEDWKLVVAKNEKHATILAIKFLEEKYGVFEGDYQNNLVRQNVPGYYIEEIDEVDGYKINIKQQKEND